MNIMTIQSYDNIDLRQISSFFPYRCHSLGRKCSNSLEIWRDRGLVKCSFFVAGDEWQCNNHIELMQMDRIAQINIHVFGDFDQFHRDHSTSANWPLCACFCFQLSDNCHQFADILQDLGHVEYLHQSSHIWTDVAPFPHGSHTGVTNRWCLKN